MKAISEAALAATLDRLILCLMLLALAGVLTAAMGFQYLDGEIHARFAYYSAWRCSHVALA